MADQRYQILESLGEGGSGSVFLALDTVLQRRVAIKRLLTAEGAVRTDDEITAIKREAATMAQLRHENIVTTFDIAEDAEGLFIVMELVEGRDLEAWLRFQPLVWNDFAQVVMQTLDAMLAAHQKNILHLDLKPQNIRVQRLPDGRLKTSLLDFGLAQLATGPQKQRLSQDGRLFGTVHYMAPEQFRLEELDTRTDLYALGCIYYECLTGKAPFDGATSVAVRDAHLAHEITPLKEKRPDLPPPLCDWVMWLIMPDRADRPNDAGAALQSFHNLCYQIAAWSAHHDAIPVSLAQPVEIIPATASTAAAPSRSSVVSRTAAVRGPARLPGAMVQKAAVNKAAFIAIGAVLLIFAAWLMLRPENPPAVPGPSAGAGKAPGSKNQGAPPVGMGAPKKAGAPTRSQAVFASLPVPDALVARFVSGGTVLTFDDASHPSLEQVRQPARDGQPAAMWRDVASKMGFWQMVQPGRLVDSAPKLVSVNAPGLRDPMMGLRFDGQQGLRLPGIKWRPAGGCTVVVVFRPRFKDTNSTRMRVFDMTDGSGPGGAAFSLLVSRENGDSVRAGCNLGHGAKFANVTAERPAGDAPVIAAAALDLTAMELRMRVRSTAGWDQTGKIARVTGRPPAPYVRLGIGPSVKPDGTVGTDAFSGEVFELLIYDTAFQTAQMGALLDSLAGYYFVH